MIGPQAIGYHDEVERPVIEAIQRGDAEAMTEFVHRNTRWVRSVIFGVLGRASDIDDVAQRVWLTVWREAPRLAEVDLDSSEWDFLRAHVRLDGPVPRIRFRWMEARVER